MNGWTVRFSIKNDDFYEHRVTECEHLKLVYLGNYKRKVDRALLFHLHKLFLLDKLSDKLRYQKVEW